MPIGFAHSTTAEYAGGELRPDELELATALEELRELARGIHPAILTDREIEEIFDLADGMLPDKRGGAEATAEQHPRYATQITAAAKTVKIMPLPWLALVAFVP